MARIPKNLDSRKNNVSFEIVTLTNFKYYDDIHNRIKAIQSNSIRQEALSCRSECQQCHLRLELSEDEAFLSNVKLQ